MCDDNLSEAPSLTSVLDREGGVRERREREGGVRERRGGEIIVCVMII